MKKVRKIISVSEQEFDFFEIWVDYLDDFSNEELKSFINDLKGKLIVVMRRKNCIKAKMPLTKRKEVISTMKGSEAIVDLDIDLNHEELIYLNRKQRIKLIVSYHNYFVTANEEDLYKITSRILSYKPDIIKIATMCKKPDDALLLLQLLRKLKNENRKCIVLGMGQEGIITRIAGVLWGNELSYTPINSGGATAAGQMTKRESEKLLNLIGDFYGG